MPRRPARSSRTSRRRFGAVTILVNNAGITRDNLLLRMKDEEWDAIMATNLKPAYRALEGGDARHDEGAPRPHHQHRQRGRQQRQRRDRRITPPRKPALIGFTKSLAQEVGSRNITVNCVAPGFIDTDMTKALPDAAREALLAQDSARPARARPRTSPMRWLTSRARAALTSRARRCTSTAACTWCSSAVQVDTAAAFW